MIMDDSRRAVRRALIIFLAAVLVSVLAALTMIGFAALARSLAWSVIGGLLVAALVSWILGFLMLRRDRKLRPSALRRLVVGPLVPLGCAAVISLTWLYPGTGAVRPDPIAGVEWLDLPDGSRLALHVTRAAAATQPPIIFVHGGPGVADMAHYVYDRIGTGASTRLPDPTGYTTARAVQDLETSRCSWSSRPVTTWHARRSLDISAHFRRPS
jgi:hypothetical protein